MFEIERFEIKIAKSIIKIKITIISLGNKKQIGFLHAPVRFVSRNPKFISLACIIVMNTMSKLILKLV